MSCDLALTVAVQFNSLYYLLVPLARIVQNALEEDRIERRSVGKSLAFGDLRDMMTFMEMVRVAVNEFVITQEDLPFNIRPDGFFIDAPGDELAVFSQSLGPCPAELSENPVRGEAGMGLLLAGSGQIAGPFPVAGALHHAGAYRIQDNVSTGLQEMRILLDDDRFVSALEKMACSMAPVIEELGVNAVHLAHAEGEVSIRGFNEEMIVVVHQAVGMA